MFFSSKVENLFICDCFEQIQNFTNLTHQKCAKSKKRKISKIRFFHVLGQFFIIFIFFVPFFSCFSLFATMFKDMGKIPKTKAEQDKMWAMVKNIDENKNGAIGIRKKILK